MQYFKLFVFTFLLTAMTGCVTLDEEVYINHQNPPPTQNVLKVGVKKPINVVHIDDRRDENPKTVIHKKNPYGEMISGVYLAEHSISSIVQNALIDGLHSAGYKITQAKGGYILSGSINNIDEKFVLGIFTGIEIVETSVTLRLTDPNGNLVWFDSITGHGKVSLGWHWFYKEKMIKAFNASIDNIVYQLQESQSFYNAVK